MMASFEDEFMIGIIGAGNMGKAIALRIRQKVIISDKDSLKLRLIKFKRICIAKHNIGLVKSADIVILAVKPQDIIEVLKEIKPYTRGRLIISIAAGIKTSLIERILGRARVVRVMPNMPALVGKGISAITRGRFAAKRDLDIAGNIFLNMGEVIALREGFMDAVTALSGSGPAYYFLFTDMLEKAGQAIGLRRDVARKLAIATFIGSAASAEEEALSMQGFVKKVASKGGTTEAAIKVFKKRGLERIVKDAVEAAFNRSQRLGSRRGKWQR